MRKLQIIALAVILVFSLASAALASDNVITVLNTATAENGPAQTVKYSFLADGRGLMFSVDISSGDTVKIQGRATSADAWVDLKSYTADTIETLAVPAQWRAIRSVDGTAGESVVKVINIYNLPLTAQ